MALHPDRSTDFLWIEEGEARVGWVAEVAPLVPVHQTYSFAVPRELESSLSVGQRVCVRLGRRGRPVAAFIVGLDRRPWDATLRPLDSVVDHASYLTADLVELGRQIARHYVCPLGTTLKAVTPEAVRLERGMRAVRYAALSRPVSDIQALHPRMTRPRAALLAALAECERPVPVEELLRRTAVSNAVLRGAVRAGWVTLTVCKEPETSTAAPAVQVEPAFELNAEQAQALAHVAQQIDAGGFSVTLLFGVSGSGKTEVYIRAMRRVVAAGRQAILLVPEIVLTTQLVQRLAARFPDVAVHHSGLTETDRSLLWRQVAAGTKSVVIGTRSAVFAPCPRLGLLCVDEEQEGSYKNLRAPRFHVRDAAIMRAKILGIPVVLGSATPSLEVWYHSDHRPEYQRVVLRRRVRELPLPKVHIVDMRQEWVERKEMVILSRIMEERLGETFARGQQALLLINRRGFAHRIFCPQCAMRVTCPQCNVGLVVHAAAGVSLCHYCHARLPTPTTCPNVSCGAQLVHTGIGTQRVEENLARRFPSARIQRVDSDTMTHRSQYQRIVDDFEARRIDCLVGTQMIAKGLDFPHVSFVGVIDADPTRMGSDFRAEERLFQLITQVAGRAGRADATGRVVVQTTMSALPSLQFALSHDYEAFAAAELAIRGKVGLPPFRRLARFVLAHAREEAARQAAEELTLRIREALVELALATADVVGPNPCALTRLRGKYRYDVLARTAGASDLRLLTEHLEQSGALRVKAASLVVDVDPVELS
ncbi:MAG: primosomal protein N' [Planctomycetes bacterium]|nr:primosomal protein N' [Planctomycetota bacterium]